MVESLFGLNELGSCLDAKVRGNLPKNHFFYNLGFGDYVWIDMNWFDCDENEWFDVYYVVCCLVFGWNVYGGWYGHFKENGSWMKVGQLTVNWEVLGHLTMYEKCCVLMNWLKEYGINIYKIRMSIDTLNSPH